MVANHEEAFNFSPKPSLDTVERREASQVTLIDLKKSYSLNF